MTLTKKKMVSEIGRRTRLRNYDVERVIEALMDTWSEQLASGGRIELENFLVLEIQRIDRGEQRGLLKSGQPRQVIHRLIVRPSKKLKTLINRQIDGTHGQ